MKRPRGRPRNTGKDRRVSHSRRERFARRSVAHVTLRVREGIPSLRGRRMAKALGDCFRRGCRKVGFSICHFSIQGNHLHLIVEADNHAALARGMQGFAIRAAKAINRVAGRKGTVWNDRYYVRRVQAGCAIRDLLIYVLHNARRHDIHFKGINGLDPLSSARYFRGWYGKPELPPAPPGDPPVAPPQTMALINSWEMYGYLDPKEIPHAAIRDRGF